MLACVSTPANNSRFALGSVDGHALQIDELKGTKPTEKIDLFNKRLGVASAIVIASCIKENSVLKELKCVAARVFAFVSTPIYTLSSLRSHARRLWVNKLGPEGGAALAEGIKGNTTLQALK